MHASGYEGLRRWRIAIVAAVMAIATPLIPGVAKAETCTVFSSCNGSMLEGCGGPNSCVFALGFWGTDACPIWTRTCFARRPGLLPYAGMGDPPKPPAKTKPPCDSAAGNPIDTAGGTKFQQELDVRLPGRNMTIQRVYTSASVDRIFRWNHERRVFGDDTRMTVVRPTSGSEGFNGVGGIFTADAGLNSKLTRLSSNGTTTGWVYVSEDDEVEVYSANGLLQSITHRGGEAVTLAYGSGSFGSTYPLAQSITHASGRSVTFGYDANNNITSTTLPGGGVITYGYDATNRLTTVSYPDQKTRSYLFNEPANTASTDIPWALTGIIDERQVRLATFKFDTEGRAVSTEYAGGVNKYSVNYVTPGVTHAITDPLGSVYTLGMTDLVDANRVTSTSQPAGAGCAAASASKQYDANGNVSSTVDFEGRTTTYTYDLARNLETKRVEASGTALARTVSTQWHPDWRTPTRVAEPLKITTFVYNGQPDPTNANAVLTCVPVGTPTLPNGKPLGVLCKMVEQATTDASGSLGFTATASGTARVQTWTYNASGQVLTHNGPRTDLVAGADDITQYVYYADNQVNWRVGDLKSVTRPGGHVTQFTKYDANGRLLESIDPNGTTTTLAYSPRGWLTQVTVKASGAATGLVTSIEYDPTGQISKITQPDGSYTTRTYDPAARLTQVADNLGNKVDYTLDNMGNRTAEKWSDAGGVLRRQITRGIDALNRLKQVTGALQ